MMISGLSIPFAISLSLSLSLSHSPLHCQVQELKDPHSVSICQLSPAKWFVLYKRNLEKISCADKLCQNWKYAIFFFVWKYAILFMHCTVISVSYCFYYSTFYKRYCICQPKTRQPRGRLNFLKIWWLYHIFLCHIIYVLYDRPDRSHM